MVECYHKEEDRRRMSNIKVYRSEWKYVLTNQELSLLKSRLLEVMEIDSHTPPERQILYSLTIFW